MRKKLSAELEGWLISPDGHHCYRFHQDPKSLINQPFVFVDKWIAYRGTPSEMRSRRKLPLDNALELCGEMLLDGWAKLEEQFEEKSKVDFLEGLAA